ncbi:MAG TPA: DUF2283 domain-containing protein [Candidatus Kapabacteria bacterium]|nr:DUF2283 domain-containing protein [Candidatus Kapabacteria bacterium]
MKISYDKEVDAAYISISGEKPAAAIKVADGVFVDLTADKHLVGIEILDASQKLPLKSLFTLEFDSELVEA